MMLRRVLLPTAVAIRLAAFEPAQPGYEFEFPRDHFEHPEFETEWWYYTGNLRSPNGRRWGFELTFFRLAVERDVPKQSAWDVDQVYLAHLALTDVASTRFYRAERLNRAGPGLAGAEEGARRIWNGNWSATWQPGDPRKPSQRLQAFGEEFALDLLLQPEKQLVVHGQDGISRKADGPGKASHYISFTRLQAKGHVILDGNPHAVEGTAWMDHEFSTDSLGARQVGWDWMSIQLEDGHDLMLYGMRRQDGQHDAFSSGTFVDREGRAVHLKATDFRLEPGRTWRSRETGAEYPVEWSIEIPRLGYRLACQPLVDGQEVVGRHRRAPVYWEGAVRYSGDRDGTPVQGVGYLEMTGYDKPVWLGRKDAGQSPK